MATANAGWNRAERETPKQTSDRIIKQMRANSAAAKHKK